MASSFLARKRASLEASGKRLPPGQVLAKRWPVLTYEPEVPAIDLDTWRLGIRGLVERPIELTWEELSRLPDTTVEVDIHCVTRWSKLGMRWTGVPLATIADLAGVSQAATHVVAHSVTGYTTNVTRGDALEHETSLIATEVDGVPLPADHGGPVRLFLPHLYFWKSAKWLGGLEFLDHDEAGYWEQRGYHSRGRPWLEERYWV